MTIVPWNLGLTMQEAIKLKEWTWGSVLPCSKSSFGTVASAGSIITVGGTYWKAEAAGAPLRQWLSSVFALQPARGRWERLPDYPVRIEYSLTVVVDNRLYAIGGTNADGPVRACHFLDLSCENTSWSPSPPLPVPLARLRGGVINGVIHAISGPEGANRGWLRPL